MTDKLRIDGTANLLAAAEVVGAKRVLTQSIIFGYGYRDLGDHLLTEDDPFGVPQGDRGDPHLAAMLSTEQQAFTAAEGIALRYGLLYGGDIATTEALLVKRGIPVVRRTARLAAPRRRRHRHRGRPRAGPRGAGVQTSWTTSRPPGPTSSRRWPLPSARPNRAICPPGHYDSPRRTSRCSPSTPRCACRTRRPGTNSTGTPLPHLPGRYGRDPRSRPECAVSPVPPIQRTQRRSRVVGQWFVNAVLVLTALQFLLLGAWAFGWPHGFYQVVAQFPPFSRHLIHDAGAFQLGIGAAMLGGLFWYRDALFAVLAGASVAAVTHAIPHITDRHMGGRAGDAYILSVLAVLLLIATALRVRRNAGLRDATADDRRSIHPHPGRFP